MFRIGVLTISDSCSAGKKEDESGKIIVEMVKAIEGGVQVYEIVPDEFDAIQSKLIDYSDNQKLDIIITTGGTGFSPRDITPEVTQSVADKIIPGISELIRAEGIKKTRLAALSRGLSVIRKNSIIVNLPGSPKGVKESLSTILDLIPHSLKMLKGLGHEEKQKI